MNHFNNVIYCVGIFISKIKQIFIDMRHVKTTPPLVLCFISVIIISLICTMLSKKILILNITRTMPLGLYFVSHRSPYTYGDILCFEIPENVRKMVVERKWLGERNSYSLKHLTGLPGDHLCVDDSLFVINGKTGELQPHDSMGWDLPEVSHCGPISENHYFVGEIKMAKSFDSRYFGPINKNIIIGKAIPILTF